MGHKFSNVAMDKKFIGYIWGEDVGGPGQIDLFVAGELAGWGAALLQLYDGQRLHIILSIILQVLLAISIGCRFGKASSTQASSTLGQYATDTYKTSAMIKAGSDSIKLVGMLCKSSTQFLEASTPGHRYEDFVALVWGNEGSGDKLAYLSNGDQKLFHKTTTTAAMYTHDAPHPRKAKTSIPQRRSKYSRFLSLFGPKQADFTLTPLDKVVWPKFSPMSNTRVARHILSQQLLRRRRPLPPFLHSPPLSSIANAVNEAIENLVTRTANVLADGEMTEAVEALVDEVVAKVTGALREEVAEEDTNDIVEELVGKLSEGLGRSLSEERANEVIVKLPEVVNAQDY